MRVGSVMLPWSECHQDGMEMMASSIAAAATTMMMMMMLMMTARELQLQDDHRLSSHGVDLRLVHAGDFQVPSLQWWCLAQSVSS
jgi:hypothetical protein